MNEIITGDCLEVLRTLPDESADAVITDPPYSSGGFTRSDRAADPSAKYVQTGTQVVRASSSGDNRDGRSWCYWSTLWISECLRIVKEHGYLLTFTDWRMLPAASDALQAGGFVWRGVISWDKGPSARAPHTGYFRHQCEYIVWGTKGVTRPSEPGRGPWPGAYQATVLQRDKHHMTGKPTKLIEQLCRCVPPGGVVLDPFAGSCTTAVAAHLCGREYICIEQSPEYVDIGKRRLQDEVPLFAGAD